MKASLVSSKEAKTIYELTLNRMQVNQQDHQVMMDALPSLQNLATVDVDSLRSRCPAEFSACNRICSFFEGSI
jgi:hypothetical protein